MPTGEVDTSAIVQDILDSGGYPMEAKFDTIHDSQGKELFVPKIDKASAGRMDVMKIYDNDDLTRLPAGVWGIREPDDRWNGRKRLSGLSERNLYFPLINAQHKF